MAMAVAAMLVMHAFDPSTRKWISEFKANKFKVSGQPGLHRGNHPKTRQIKTEMEREGMGWVLESHSHQEEPAFGALLCMFNGYAVVLLGLIGFWPECLSGHMSCLGCSFYNREGLLSLAQGTWKVN